MGDMITLRCPKCGLNSGILHIGWGWSRQCYGVAWCPRCQKFTTPMVKKWEGPECSQEADEVASKLETLSLLDDRSIACPPDYANPDKPRIRCLNCCQEVPLFDMENKPCPLCGTKMEETLVGCWD